VVPATQTLKIEVFHGRSAKVKQKSSDRGNLEIFMGSDSIGTIARYELVRSGSDRGLFF
jgi:hypothetical protein